MMKPYLFNTKLTHSKHSSLRCNQRNIDDEKIHYTYEYGDMIVQNNDCQIYYFSRRVYNFLSVDKKLAKKLRSMVGTVVVVLNDLIVTTYRNYDEKKFYTKYKKYEIYQQC